MSREKLHYRYHSYIKLKDRLGLFDAVVECNELAIREFLSNLSLNDNPNSYIKEMSAKHSIKVDAVNTSSLTSRVRQFYIMSVYQQADQFFDEFKKEHKAICKSEWEKRNDGETDIDYMLRTLSNSTLAGKQLIGGVLYDTFSYYRKIRNRFAHTEDDTEGVDRDLSNLSQYKVFYNERYDIKNAPNQYKSINFDDFLLATIVVKEIAFKFCNLYRPTNQQIVAEIHNQINEQKRVGAITLDYKGINKIKNKKEKYLNAMKHYLNTNFGIFDESDYIEIINLLNSAV